MSLFTIIRFKNDPCSSTIGANGTCYNADECARLGGTISGACASGFGVCCVCKFHLWYLSLDMSSLSDPDVYSFSQIFNTYFVDEFPNTAKSNMYQYTFITQLNDSLYVLANIRQSAFIYDLAVNTNCALAFFSCPITFMAIQKDLYK